MKQMTRAALIGALLTLAACGVDGEPTAPEPRQKAGISITGRAEVGVSKSW